MPASQSAQELLLRRLQGEGRWGSGPEPLVLAVTLGAPRDAPRRGLLAVTGLGLGFLADDGADSAVEFWPLARGTLVWQDVGGGACLTAPGVELLVTQADGLELLSAEIGMRGFCREDTQRASPAPVQLAEPPEPDPPKNWASVARQLQAECDLTTSREQMERLLPALEEAQRGAHDHEAVQRVSQLRAALEGRLPPAAMPEVAAEHEAARGAPAPGAEERAVQPPLLKPSSAAGPGGDPLWGAGCLTGALWLVALVCLVFAFPKLTLDNYPTAVIRLVLVRLLLWVTVSAPVAYGLALTIALRSAAPRRARAVAWGTVAGTAALVAGAVLALHLAYLRDLQSHPREVHGVVVAIEVSYKDYKGRAVPDKTEYLVRTPAGVSERLEPKWRVDPDCREQATVHAVVLPVSGTVLDFGCEARDPGSTLQR